MDTFIRWDFGVQAGVSSDMDYPSAWAIQKEVGPTLAHQPRCSSVPGWHPISGDGLLCDCGAVEQEYIKRKGQR